MKKSDLENGMIVELRNGGKYMVIRNFTNKTICWTENILLGYENNGGYMTLEDYCDDLYCIANTSISKKYDIMKVFCLEKCSHRKLRLLWERESNIKLIQRQLGLLLKFYKIMRYDISKDDGEYKILIRMQKGIEVETYITDETIEEKDEHYIYLYLEGSIRSSIRRQYFNK